MKYFFFSIFPFFAFLSVSAQNAQNDSTKNLIISGNMDLYGRYSLNKQLLLRYQLLFMVLALVG
jgi:hypothetical protein